MLAYAFYESDTRVMQYASALAGRGDHVDVIALRRENAPAFEVLDAVRVYRLQARQANERGQLSYLLRILKFFIVSSWFLARKHIANPYDAIHVHSVPDFLVFAAVVPKLLGAKVVLDIHDILPEFYASKFGTGRSVWFRVLALVEKASSAFADHVIIANHLWRERLISRSVRSEKCTAIINYPDPNIFYSRPRLRDDGKFLILYPGTLNHHQGVDIAIRAFAAIAAEIPEAEFHIYGEGPERSSLVALAERLGLSDRVLFHGFLPTRQVAAIMAQADLAVVPKRISSGFGNEAASTKIMEFMSLGVPVIVARTRIDSYYHDETMVKFFEPEDHDDLATCILELWKSPEYRWRLAMGGLRYVRQNQWQKKSQEYRKLIDDLSRIRSPRLQTATSSQTAHRCADESL